MRRLSWTVSTVAQSHERVATLKVHAISGRAVATVQLYLRRAPTKGPTNEL
jgi:hypothetical protein